MTYNLLCDICGAVLGSTDKEQTQSGVVCSSHTQAEICACYGLPLPEEPEPAAENEQPA